MELQVPDEVIPAYEIELAWAFAKRQMKWLTREEFLRAWRSFECVREDVNGDVFESIWLAMSAESWEESPPEYLAFDARYLRGELGDVDSGEEPLTPDRWREMQQLALARARGLADGSVTASVNQSAEEE